MPPTGPREYRLDLILGADHYSQVMGKCTPLGGGLGAYRTPFGRVLCGPASGPGQARQGVYNKEIRGNACLLAAAVGYLVYVDTGNPGHAVSLYSFSLSDWERLYRRRKIQQPPKFRSTERLQDGRYQVALSPRKIRRLCISQNLASMKVRC